MPFTLEECSHSGLGTGQGSSELKRDTNHETILIAHREHLERGREDHVWSLNIPQVCQDEARVAIQFSKQLIDY